jgi:hypothetical protein
MPAVDLVPAHLDATRGRRQWESPLASRLSKYQVPVDLVTGPRSERYSWRFFTLSVQQQSRTGRMNGEASPRSLSRLRLEMNTIFTTRLNSHR